MQVADAEYASDVSPALPVSVHPVPRTFYNGSVHSMFFPTLTSNAPWIGGGIYAYSFVVITLSHSVETSAGNCGF